MGVARLLFVLLLACSSAKNHEGDSGSAEPDAGNHPARDAAADGAPDAPTSLAIVLTERDRAARLTCPCRVETGAFESVEACIDKTGYDQALIECLSAAVAPFDGPELREQLACEARAGKQRSHCLETASCEVISSSACNEHALGCPMVDPQVTTQLLRACPGASVLGRR